MAEVLAPLASPSSSITMLHSRPSTSDAYQTPSGTSYQQPPRLGQAPRSVYNTSQHSSYRGTAAAPVQPYAFQSTPHLMQEARTTSAPSVQQLGPVGSQRQGHTQSTSTSTSSSDTSSIPSTNSGAASKDDSVMGSRPASLINLSSSIPDLSLTSFGEQSVKASPNRYRRTSQRSDSSNATSKLTLPQPQGSAAPSGSGMGSDGQLYSQVAAPVPKLASVDEMAMPKNSQSDLAKRYRRRTLNTLETQTPAGQNTFATLPGALLPAHARPASRDEDDQSQRTSSSTIRAVSYHTRTPSSGTTHSPQDSAQTYLSKTDSHLEPKMRDIAKPVSPTAQRLDSQQVNVPPRGSSDANKRLNATSPLARQTFDDDKQGPTAAPAPAPKMTYAAAAAAPSPAAQHLAALSDKDLNKGMKSRLRRAFSFGSAQELRKASAEHSANPQQTKRLQKERSEEDTLDAEQEEIARRQEAAGIGAGIYSGQGGFTGSTDNVSISSTASSASMMLRKMGQGAKKSARSIKGLFRPKSVIGVPAADGPVVQPSLAQVSMVTVEADRQRANVNAHPAEQSHGGTGLPKLERNTVDAASAAASTAGLDTRGSADGSDSVSRRSIVGSDKDRAEVLAAVKKGILKRSGTGSPNGSPVIKPTDNGPMTAVPHIVESPPSSMPSTPKDGQPQGHSASLNIGNVDYFGSRIATLTRSVPNTPNGTMRNISFSPRIQFHDAWSSTEYDRRGEIATCNRLTPMLAQQIKEELNTFKMEMEVHELSKPHTHFF